MEAAEVGLLMDPENRAVNDERRDEAYVRVKLNVFDVAFHRIEGNNVFSDRITVGEKFGWVPFPCGSFVDMLLEAFTVFKGDRAKRFIDVGAGIGTKIVLASVLFDSYGIELDEALWEKSKALGVHNRIAVGDATTFKDYGSFDMIYYYRPIQDKETYLRLEQTIYGSMKPGAMVAPMDSELNWAGLPDIERVSKFWFRKTPV